MNEQHDDEEFIRTDSVVDADELRDFLTYCDADLAHCDIIETLDGQWRREPDGFWRFWELPEEQG